MSFQWFRQENHLATQFLVNVNKKIMRRYKKKRTDKKTSFSDIKEMMEVVEFASPKISSQQQTIWEMISFIRKELDIYKKLSDDKFLKIWLKKVEFVSAIKLFFLNIFQFKNPFRARFISNKQQFIHSKYAVENCMHFMNQISEGIEKMRTSAEEFIDNCDKEKHISKAQKLVSVADDVIRRCNDTTMRLRDLHTEMIFSVEQI